MVAFSSTRFTSLIASSSTILMESQVGLPFARFLGLFPLLSFAALASAV